jgi:hypothetical protein
MREPDIPEGAETVTLDVELEIYLQRRSDPIQCIGTFYFQREHLVDDDLAESFMALVANTLRSVMEDRTRPLVIFSDRYGNKFLIEASEVQAMSAHAPTSDTIMEALKEEKG